MRKPLGPPRQNPSRPGYLELDTHIDIIGVAPDNVVLPPRGPSHLREGPFGFRRAESAIKNRAAIVSKINELEQEYQIRSSQLTQAIEADLAAVRLEGAHDPIAPVPSVIRELQVVKTLHQRKTAELHNKTMTANAFYGGDPFNWNIHDFMLKATKMEQWPEPNGIAMRALNQSLGAANDTKLLNQTLQYLHQRTTDLQNFLNALQAAEQAQLAAIREAQRVAAEQARIRAEAEALALAREKERLAALAEAERVAAEQARIAAEAAARYIAAEQARLEAEAEVKRQAEQLRLENQRQAEEQALRDAMEALVAAKGTRPFRVSGAAAASGPVFSVAAGTLAVDAATTLAIRTALRSAAAAAITASAAVVGTASGVVIIVGVAALVYHALRDNKEPYALSVPLSDLTTYSADELHAIALGNGEIELPVALGSRAVGNTIEFSVAATNGITLPRKVPVRLATYDPDLNIYRTDNPNAPALGMTWTPIFRPGDASTVLPSEDPNVVPYTGVTPTALEGRIDQNPELDLYSFGGVIYEFPSDSGIAPQYVMFRDRRSEPGVASGAGQSVSANWLGTASTLEGAPIPKQIANKLRGREFANFNAFRREFWKAVANDLDLSSNLSRLSKIEAEKGLAAKAPIAEHVGKRTKYELHHVTPISENGAIYDIDNIMILTPKAHIESHSKNGGKLK